MEQKILVVGSSGNMGGLTTQRALAEGYGMMPFGIDVLNKMVISFGKPVVNFDTLNQPQFQGANDTWLDLIRKNKPIIIDFTHKSVILDNFNNHYKHWGCPLIVGTIGVKKEDFVGNTAPVIIGSPNLCPQIVAILKAFSSLEEGSLKGIKFAIDESHQASKKEISGTAIYMKELFERAGAIEKEPIYVIRNKEEQLRMGVPEEFLDGHGWHMYRFLVDPVNGDPNCLTDILSKWFLKVASRRLEREDRDVVGKWESEDKTLAINVRFYAPLHGCDIMIEFFHDVNGRQPYSNGLFETVLPKMKEMVEVGNNVVYDMFNL